MHRLLPVRRLLVYAGVFVLGALVLRVAVVPAEVCPSITPAQARSAIDEAAAWLERGLRPAAATRTATTGRPTSSRSTTTSPGTRA